MIKTNIFYIKNNNIYTNALFYYDGERYFDIGLYYPDRYNRYL